MKRRDFLKISLGSAAAIASGALATELLAGNKTDSDTVTGEIVYFIKKSTNVESMHIKRIEIPCEKDKEKPVFYPKVKNIAFDAQHDCEITKLNLNVKSVINKYYPCLSELMESKSMNIGNNILPLSMRKGDTATIEFDSVLFSIS